MGSVVRPAVARVQGFSPLPAEVLIPALMQMGLPEQFADWLNLKGVRQVEDQQGPWQIVGQRRVLRMTDGSITKEQLVAFDRTTGWSNVLFDFSNSSRHIVTEIDDDWRFSKRVGGTQVTWSWTFHPQSTYFGRFMSHAMAAPLHRVYLNRILQASLRTVETQTLTSTHTDGQEHP